MGTEKWAVSGWESGSLPYEMQLHEFWNKSEEKKIIWKHKIHFTKYFYYLAFPTTIPSTPID